MLYHLPDIDRGLAEIGRVLRTGGRLVVVTYHRDHLSELFELGPARADLVDDATGAALERHFQHVERQELVGRATFPTHDSLRAFLDAFGAFSWFADPSGPTALDDVEVPYTATYRHLLYMAS